jgi:hypothetical protein
LNGLTAVMGTSHPTKSAPLVFATESIVPIEFAIRGIVQLLLIAFVAHAVIVVSEADDERIIGADVA